MYFGFATLASTPVDICVSVARVNKIELLSQRAIRLNLICIRLLYMVNIQNKTHIIEQYEQKAPAIRSCPSNVHGETTAKIAHCFLLLAATRYQKVNVVILTKGTMLFETRALGIKLDNNRLAVTLTFAVQKRTCRYCLCVPVYRIN